MYLCIHIHVIVVIYDTYTRPYVINSSGRKNSTVVAALYPMKIE